MTTIKAIEESGKRMDEIGKRGTASIKERIDISKFKNNSPSKYTDEEKQALIDKMMRKNKPQDKGLDRGR